jgi:peroxiredoxin
MPEFELENAEGNLIRSKVILAKKQMVLSFYRGRW